MQRHWEDKCHHFKNNSQNIDTSTKIWKTHMENESEKASVLSPLPVHLHHKGKGLHCPEHLELHSFSQIWKWEGRLFFCQATQTTCFQQSGFPQKGPLLNFSYTKEKEGNTRLNATIKLQVRNDGTTHTTRDQSTSSYTHTPHTRLSSVIVSYLLTCVWPYRWHHLTLHLLIKVKAEGYVVMLEGLMMFIVK